jgi:exosortase
MKRVSTRVGAVFIFLAALWLVLWRQLSGEWSVNDQYSYGWFVPVFALFLFWLRWEDRPVVAARDLTSEKRIRRALLSILLGAVALLLLLPIRLFEIANPDWRPLNWVHTAIVAGLTLLIIWYAGGKPWLRHFAFPVLFIFVAVPWVTPIEVPIVQGLMRLVAAIASETVNLFGVPARLEGNLIRTHHSLVGVNEAGSGVRSLQTALMIGLLVGELKRLSIRRRVALVVSAAAIAFLGNCVRAFFLVWIAATKDIQAVDRWHDLGGYSIVVAVFLGSLALSAFFGREKGRIKKEELRNQNAAAETAATKPLSTLNVSTPQHTFLVPDSYFVAVALSWILVAEVAAASWYRAHERNLVTTARWEVEWPQHEANFHEIKIDETVQRILRCDQGRAAVWTWPGFATLDLASSFTARPPDCSLFFFRWNPGKSSALLANLHRPDVCLPAAGWEQVADTGVKDYPAGAGLTLPFRHFEFRHVTRDNKTPQVAHAFYCLWEDRVSVARSAQMTTSASAWTRGERIGAVLQGRRHLGQQVMELVVQTRGAVDFEQVEARFAQVLPDLIKVTSDK